MFNLDGSLYIPGIKASLMHGVRSHERTNRICISCPHSTVRSSASCTDHRRNGCLSKHEKLQQCWQYQTFKHHSSNIL